MRNCNLNYVEESTYYNHWYPGINPNNPDSDGDGYTDGVEIKYGTDPTDKNSYPISYLLMFYMAADATIGEFTQSTQSLSDYANQYINELKEIKGVGGRVRVVAEIDNYSNSQNPNAYRIFINETHTYSINIGEVDTGDPETLVNFVKWAVDNNHAIHYALIIWSHGKGWKGVAEDDTNIDDLNMSELHKALSEIDSYMSRKLDVIIFNACMMGNFEVAYEIQRDANIMVASPEPMSVRVWPFTNITKDLLTKTANNIDYHPIDFVSEVVLSDYIEEYNSKNGLSKYVKLISAFELNDTNTRNKWIYIDKDIQCISKWLYDNFSNEIPLKNGSSATIAQLFKRILKNMTDDDPNNDVISYYGINNNERYPYFYDINLLSYIFEKIDWNSINANNIQNDFNFISLLHLPPSKGGIRIGEYDDKDYSHEPTHYPENGYYVFFISIYLLDYHEGYGGESWFTYDNSYNDTQFALDTYWNDLLWKLNNTISGGG